MSLSAKTVRSQLGMLKGLLGSCSLETVRKGQNMVGELMGARHRRDVLIKQHDFADFEAAWVLPRDVRREGVILYLHGGGYTCGGLEYAIGFGSVLASRFGVRTFCAAYRLAPENRYPAAIEDALTAYQYLLSKGYSSNHIMLCGESAGGGLCYSLCLKLRQLQLPMPAGIIAISPWTDLTSSGPSYEDNREVDPSMTLEKLRFFADAYTDTPEEPLASPLFADLSGMPPSCIFVGGDEIMESDSVLLKEKLIACGCRCQLTIAPERWHGYLLYGLEEDRADMEQIEQFLTKNLSQQNKLRWMRLDNAAKIYPAARRENWASVFRLSATLTEAVDPAILRSALDVTVRRFPPIAARLRRGVFWYYLEQISAAPALQEEHSFPLTRMSRAQVRKCALRVIVYGKRIAVEFFHSLTDGTGGLIFLKTLLAEYLQQRYGISVPAEKGVLGRLEEPSDEELEDSFLRYSGPIGASRKENDAWRLRGTPEPDGFLHLTCFTLPVQEMLDAAHDYGVSLTAFLAATMLLALQQIQAEHVPDRKRRKHLRILIPVNLRRLFPSRTLRNFAMFTTPEIDPRLGEYTLQEICKVIHHQMGLEVTSKHMGRIIAANVGNERMLVVRLMPLFIKNIVMKAVFNAVGERKSCLNMSNLGAVELPESMKPYVTRMDFILGAQATQPYNCGVLSYGDKLYVNFIRNIKEPELEYRFHCILRELGIRGEVQSNRPEQ